MNYEDPNYNVALPVLTIHGNHDDPAGAENLSAVDILSTCRLVNYFGKVGAPCWRITLGEACVDDGQRVKLCCASSATLCYANSAALRRPSTVLTALVAAALATQHQLVSTHTHSPPPQAAIEGSGVGKLRIAPVLLQKGGTRVSAAAAALELTSPPVRCHESGWQLCAAVAVLH